MPPPTVDTATETGPPVKSCSRTKLLVSRGNLKLDKCGTDRKSDEDEFNGASSCHITGIYSSVLPFFGCRAARTNAEEPVLSNEL